MDENIKLQTAQSNKIKEETDNLAKQLLNDEKLQTSTADSLGKTQQDLARQFLNVNATLAELSNSLTSMDLKYDLLNHKLDNLPPPKANYQQIQQHSLSPQLYQPAQSNTTPQRHSTNNNQPPPTSIYPNYQFP